MLRNPDFKRRVQNKHTPNDAVYLKIPETGKKFTCPFCSNSGRPKGFRHLWSLYNHICYNHNQKSLLGDDC
ncbi:hypothetical protein [Nitrosopumilus sp. b3]|uniref:hypothetical protein n=1 Tax=Nitrosopumilus sp. b3 TaxID=2109909 RepID=UPI0015F5E432|nr:hypothetical protein [Nitrosopumilus sp. b3]